MLTRLSTTPTDNSRDNFGFFARGEGRFQDLKSRPGADVFQRLEGTMIAQALGRPIARPIDQLWIRRRMASPTISGADLLTRIG